MKLALAIALGLAVISTPSASFAYTTTNPSGDPCTTAKACDVYCSSGVLAGTMYWNGAKWSDGIRSDADKDVVARQIVAAQGSSCT